MRKLFIIFAVLIAAWAWKAGKFSGNEEVAVFDAEGKPRTVIYTAEACGAPCNEAIAELRRRKVAFEQLIINPFDETDSQVKIWQRYNDQRFPLILSGKTKLAGMSKTLLISMLAENYGLQYLTPNERRYYKRHFYSDGKPKIVMYGTAWCSYCTKLRKELRDDGQDFLDIDVEKSGEMRLMSETMDIGGYPVMYVGYTRVNGSSLAAVKAAMPD